MAIVKWRGWGPWWSPRLFDDEELNKLTEWPDFSKQRGGLDMYETDNTVVVEAQVPGIKEENIDVAIEGNVLTITANEKEEEEKKKKKKTIYKSSRRTSFNYATTLPNIVDIKKADAEIDNGVITITFPKTSEEKKKTIQVKKKS